MKIEAGDWIEFENRSYVVDELVGMFGFVCINLFDETDIRYLHMAQVSRITK